ncbi:hypothetical protein PoB_002417500 [Plakobranchus ocellatus]|uniref:Uncharacterized protein n=1 Tax=Plakobranchus ocellatus TaxID=259542 RepID=A0AAV3ZPM0_9GAST|nr:hypothetical protein PoB_002417500 [Plakobranchus ocellatus]
MSNSQDRKGSLARLPNVHTRGPTLHTGKVIWQDFQRCTQEVQLSTRYRQLGKTSECTRKRSNSQHEIGIWKNFQMYTQDVQLLTRDWNMGRLPNIHTRGATLHTGKAIWQDFRICTHEVQLSTQYRGVGKISECAHKRSNSQHVIGSWARLPNVHTRGPTRNTG